MRSLSVLIMSSALLLVYAAAWADAPVYKWVDSKGIVHYSSTPHSDDAKPIDIVNKGNVLTQPPAPSTAAPASGDKSAVAVGPDDSAACKAAKTSLNSYLTADYLYTLGPKGEKQQLPKDQQEKAIADARTQVALACKAGG
jgi:Domain of unknown function (DUF4124)